MQVFGNTSFSSFHLWIIGNNLWITQATDASCQLRGRRPLPLKLSWERSRHSDDRIVRAPDCHRRGPLGGPTARLASAAPTASQRERRKQEFHMRWSSSSKVKTPLFSICQSSFTAYSTWEKTTDCKIRCTTVCAVNTPQYVQSFYSLCLFEDCDSWWISEWFLLFYAFLFSWQ